MPQSSMDELTREFVRPTGVRVGSATIRKALKRVRCGTRAPAQGAAPPRYGYTAAHRRQAPPTGMNTDLSNAQWTLVSDLFERKDTRGALCTHDRRDIVNACMYIVRTGGA